MAGRHHDTKRRRSRKASSETSSSSSYSFASSSDSETPEPRRRSSSGHRVKSGRHHRSRKEREEEGSRKRSRKRKERRRARDKEEEESRRRRRKKPQRSDSDGSYDNRDSEADESSDSKAVAGLILERFPDVADDLKQLLQMIDNGQGVDLGGVLKKSLAKLLRKLFWSLKLKENDDGIFFLPPKGIPTLEIIGSTICSHSKSQGNQLLASRSPNGRQLSPSDIQHMKSEDDANAVLVEEKDLPDKPSTPPRRRLIGPEMPSRELLAAAAELTEAETLLREADLEVDNNLFIGPPPPAVVAEAESANEAERFEEVARIATAEVDKPYDVLGVNWKMSSENIKKRYWKLSLMVHPDKCSHPQAHQAFVKLNKAFKELQDPEKRKEIDEKIKLKEEQEAFMAELKSLREAAQWRRLQGISMEGDEELLAVPKEAPKRDEWMTTLPPERKPGMTMQSTLFSRTTKEGRGDTSVWTDSPLDKAQKAKQNYLEAYNKAKSLADADEKKKGVGADADLVDKYNASKRGKSLMQKHQEESKKPKKKAKQQEKVEKEEWEGQHPWKPWDREKDLATGRTEVKFDSENMAQGLASRFSSGAMQRNFL